MSTIYKAYDNWNWTTSLESVGIAPLSLDTCCKLLAILYTCAIEEFVFHDKLRTDITYAQRRCRLNGAETPDGEAVPLIKRYVSDMESAPYDEDDETPWAVVWPQWAVGLMRDRYDITLPKQRIA